MEASLQQVSRSSYRVRSRRLVEIKNYHLQIRTLSFYGYFCSLL